MGIEIPTTIIPIPIITPAITIAAMEALALVKKMQIGKTMAMTDKVQWPDITTSLKPAVSVRVRSTGVVCIGHEQMTKTLETGVVDVGH